MTTQLEVAVPAAVAGERLDRFVGGLETVGSRAEAERLVREGRILVDGRPRSKSYRLEGNEVISLDLPDRRESPLEPEQLDLVIAYEDESLLIVDKPAGLVVHPSAGHATGTLVHGLLGRGIAGGEEPERPGIVHRLDRDTSGLLVVARDAQTHRRLQRLIRKRELTREYLALVRGRPRSWRGRIEAPIGRDRVDQSRISIDTDAPRAAVTHFDVVELLGRPRAAPGAAGDGADASDPGAPRGDRPARGGRSDLRGTERPWPRTAVPPRNTPRVPTPAVGSSGRSRVAAAGRPRRARSIAPEAS